MIRVWHHSWSSTTRRRWRPFISGFRVFACSLLLVLTLTIAGCAQHSSGNLTLKSQSQPGTELSGGFTAGYYSLDDKNHLTVLLLDGTSDDPTQVVTLRMFWRPRAGRTPIDATATNATIHYTVFSGDDGQQVGVYSGAGFIHPVGQVGRDRFTADLWQGTLRLADRTEGFQDLLGQAILEGHLTAAYDEEQVSRGLRRLESLITDRLGYPRWLEMW